MTKVKIALIGLGHQSCSDHLPAIMECSDLELVAVCDRNEKISIEISEKYNVPYFNSVDEMLLKVVPDIAIVAVPHDAYLPIIKSLAKKHIYIIKEKPFATNMMRH